MGMVAAALISLPVAHSAFAQSAAKTVQAAADNVKVNLNKADAKSLMQINGMSAYKAHAIIAYRNKNGAFKDAAELEKVNGFKRMKPDAIKTITDHLIVE